MKQHFILVISSLALVIIGAAALITTVWFTVFGVMLAEEPDESISIAVLCVYLIMAMISILLSMVAGINAIRNDSLMKCRNIGMFLVPASCGAWLSGFTCGQFYQIFIAAAIAAVLYVYGVQQTIRM